jgi:hypothetical protein
VTRVVGILAHECDVRQFIDVGAGIPDEPYTHEVAREIEPTARTVYVDNDPLVLVHARALMVPDGGVRVVEGDMRKPDAILTDPELRKVIDLSQPVAVLLCAVLHLLTDEEDPAAVVAGFRDALPDGSYVVITHAASDGYPEVAPKVAEMFAKHNVSVPFVPRTRAQVAGMLDGLEDVDPGLRFVAEWRAEGWDDGVNPSRWMYAGVGRKGPGDGRGNAGKGRLRKRRTPDGGAPSGRPALHLVPDLSGDDAVPALDAPGGSVA